MKYGQRKAQPAYSQLLVTTRQPDISDYHLYFFSPHLLLGQRLQSALSARMFHLNGKVCLPTIAVLRLVDNSKRPSVHITIDWLAYTQVSKKSVTRQCHKMNRTRGKRMLEGGNCGLKIKS
jgi:hypothetical protein